MSISASVDAGSFLVAPSTKGAGLTLEQLRSEAGIIVSTIDSAIQGITGFSILQEWIAKPLAGDWDAFARGANAWNNSCKAVGGVAQNMLAVGPQIGFRWQGEGAATFISSQVKVAGALMLFPPLGMAMEAACEGLTQLSGYLAKMIMAAIKELSYKVAGMLAAAATIIGAVSVPGWVASIAQGVVAWTKRIKEGIEKFKQMVEMVKKIVDQVKSAVQKIQQVLQAAQAGLNAVGLGGVGSVVGGMAQAAGTAAGAAGSAQSGLGRIQDAATQAQHGASQVQKGAGAFT
ncbi:hypothetical protein [Protaetiibacter intestinalis]|uniref:WXG100 family type VII secretion target n=1 Tax=Protaetiibacter intestinalis TaxID=2419774 RepID=A0A387B5Z4_9MICO|nr:hypothetical protein [Protaetiibacter intestinalis]AYF97747.1 hypothetical protein D7I47_05425 [Protaetiibacter intestinalis]